MTELPAAADYDAFYRAEWGQLAGTLRLMSGDAMTADEIAQEALTLAWMRWPRVSRLDRPEGWLYVTAFRLMRRRLRRESARPITEPARNLGEPDVPARVALQRALAALPVRQRQAIVARHVLGFDGPEAAALLGMRPDGFRQLLSRALRDLRVSPELLEGV
jgi:RNA polymerase sigma factor (sigma-70 family)